MNKISAVVVSCMGPGFLLCTIFSVLMGSVSLVLTGFAYGVDNNVFHIPIVLNLASTAEFKDDAFYNTLKNFTSIVWPLIGVFADESNIQDVFFAAHFANRVATFFCLVVLVRIILESKGVSPGVVVAVIGMGVTPWLQGWSIVGGHGMFIDYFTHSETTWPFVFMFLALLATNRVVASAAVAGLVFALNAFVGVWLALAGALALMTQRKALDLAVVLRSGAVFVFFASPVLIWVAMTVGGDSGAIQFSFREYVREYYPGHFLIEAVSPMSLALFAFVVFAGLLAAHYFEAGKFWVRIQFALLVILLVGVPLPYLVDNRFVFNLHLLRSAGIGQAVAIVLSLAAGVRMMLMEKDYKIQVLGLLAIFSLVVLEKSFIGIGFVILALSLGLIIKKGVLAGVSIGGWSLDWVLRHSVSGVSVSFLIVLLARAFRSELTFLNVLLPSMVVLAVIVALLRPRVLFGSSRFAAFIFALYCFAFAAKFYMWNHNGVRVEKSKVDWGHLVGWIRSSDIGGVYLLPVNDENSKLFQVEARKRVWVDWKQGAAVMWSPSFHRQWMPRYREVKALVSPGDFIAYAKENNIKNIILRSHDGSCPSPAQLIRATPSYVLCQV